MSKGTSEKKERNDIYTAFAVLALFLLFGFFITRGDYFSSEEQDSAVWIEQPTAPRGYQGYPYPHDDESVQRMPQEEEVAPLSPRKMQPVVSVAGATKVSEITTTEQPTQALGKQEPTPSLQLGNEVEQELTLDPIPEPTVAEPQVKAENVKESVRPAAKPLPKTEMPAVNPTPKVEKTEPAVKPATKTKPAPPAATNSATTPAPEKNYISSKLPCVWIVGIFKNPSNVKRVVARLRVKAFDVSTGAHKKGTYVGVPCACKGTESIATELRGIFSAQPWLLRK